MCFFKNYLTNLKLKKIMMRKTILFIVCICIFYIRAEAQKDISQKTLVGHTNGITALCFSPDNNFIVSGSTDKTIRVWDITTGLQVKIFTEHSETITALEFTKDGKYVLSASDDHTLKLWDINGENSVRTFSCLSSVKTFAFFPDGKTFLSGGGTDVMTEDEKKKVTTRTEFSSVFSKKKNDSRSTNSRSEIYKWDIETGEKIKTYNTTERLHSDIIVAISISPDGKTVVSAESGGDKNNVILWNAETSVIMQTFPFDGKGLVGYLGFTSNPDFIITFAGNPHSGSKVVDFFVGEENIKTNLQMWRIRKYSSPEVKCNFVRHSNDVDVAKISPNGNYLVANTNRKVLLYDISENGCKYLNTYEKHDGPIEAVAVSPNSKYIASGSLDNTIKLWLLTAE